MNFKALAQSLFKELGIVATQKTARLLMKAAYQGVMMLIDPLGNHGAKAAAALKVAALMGSFVTGSGLAGMAHDGISNIPKQGTWLLDKGERVVDANTNKDLKQYLAKKERPNVVQHITIQNSDEEGVLKALPKFKETVIEVVSGDISTNGRIRQTMLAYGK